MSNSSDRISLSFTTEPANTVDRRLCGYLQALEAATAAGDQVSKYRFQLALDAFWLPHALQLDEARPVAIRQAASLAADRCQDQRQYIGSLCGLDTPSETTGSHLLDLELDRQLACHKQRSDPPKVKYRLRFHEPGQTDFGALLAYLNGFGKTERLVKMLQPLRIFWLPLAYRYYGWTGDDLARVAETAIADLRRQEERLQRLFALDAPLLSQPAAAPPEPDLDDFPADDGDDGTNGNGHNTTLASLADIAMNW